MIVSELDTELDRQDEADRRTQIKYYATLNLLCDLKASIETSIDAIRESERLRVDRDYWRAKYNTEVDKSIEHNQKMMGSLISMALARDLTPFVEKGN